MAISFKEKIAYVNKYAPKSNDKVQKLIKLAVNIDSAKLNLTDEQKNKLKDGVEKAFQQFKEKNTAVKAPTPSQAPKKRGRPKGSGKKSTSSASSTKAILQNFKAKVGKKVYKRATSRTTVPIDMERPAVKPGKRIVRKKGETSNQYGTFSNKVGRKYWENRANRMDVNQPSKTRYPKLAAGGEIGEGAGARTLYELSLDELKFQLKHTTKPNETERKKLLEKLISEKEGNSKYADGGSVTSIMTMPKNMVEEIRKSAQMGYNIVRVGMISPKKKGVVLMNQDYQVRGTYPLEYKEFVEKIVEGKYGDGGSIAQGNYEMVLSKAKELHHHASELQDALKKENNIEAWVVAKVERASQDLSDVTHYLDGMSEYAQGGTLAGNLDVDGIGFGLMAKGGKLKGKQKNLDMNHNGKLDKEDFQIIRSGKRIVRKNKK